jgi:hypothetical protein
MENSQGNHYKLTDRQENVLQLCQAWTDWLGRSCGGIEMISFIAGLFVGTIVGVAVMALSVAGGRK